MRRLTVAKQRRWTGGFWAELSIEPPAQLFSAPGVEISTGHFFLDLVSDLYGPLNRQNFFSTHLGATSLS